MKLKKAKKMLAKLGIPDVIIFEKGYEPKEDEKDMRISTLEDHELDEAIVVSTNLGYDDFEITYKKLSKKELKKKAKKKDKKKKFSDNEIERIKRNIDYIKTGEGMFEEDPEKAKEREERRKHHEERQQDNRSNQRTQNTGQSNQSTGNRNYNNNHHQDRNANNRNRQRYNNYSRTNDVRDTSDSTEKEE